MGDQLTGEIIGAAIEVHRVLGPGLLESIYEGALCHEFEIRHLRFQRQVSIDVNYKGRTIQGQRLDLVVDKRVVVELKSVQLVPAVALAQVLSCGKDPVHLKRHGSPRSPWPLPRYSRKNRN